MTNHAEHFDAAQKLNHELLQRERSSSEQFSNVSPTLLHAGKASKPNKIASSGYELEAGFFEQKGAFRELPRKDFTE